MHNLAALCSDLGRIDKTESIVWTTLKQKLICLGPDHPDVFSTIKIMAMLHLKREEPHEAERILVPALKSSQNILGHDHPETLSIMDGLVVIYLETGQIVKAVNLTQHAFALSAARYGPRHPDTLGIVQNIAFCHQLMSEFDVAEDLYKEVLCEDTAAKYVQIECATHNLMEIYYKQGRVEEANQLKERMESLQC